MAKKTFNIDEDITSIANEIETINNVVKEQIKETEKNPTKENIKKTIEKINQDELLSEKDKKKIIELIAKKYIEIFNFDNCPEDYESLKEEAKFLSTMTQYSFVLMAQRLKKIKDNKMYEKDGYPDFKRFVENEMPISRQTAYKYIDIITFFDVAPGRHEVFDYTKLNPFIPLLRAENNEIPKDEIRKQSIKELKIKTKREMEEEARELKVKYGLIREKEEVKLIDKIKGEIEKLSREEKLLLKEFVSKYE